MRDVIVYETCLKKKEDFRGKFHGWGMDFIEFESGPGNYSTGIIEKEDGKIENIEAGCIQFILKIESGEV